MTAVVDNFLAHYGVKGMKWGVRKEHYREYQEKATTDSTHVIKRQAANINMVRYMAKGRSIQEKRKFDEQWYQSLSTGKEFIEAGHTLHRVVKGVDDKALAGNLYVAKRMEDSQLYRGTIPGFGSGGAFGKKEYHTAYQMELETKRKLSMPSAKERVDIFIDTLQTKEGRQWLKDNGYKKEIDELNAKEVGLKYYDRFNKYAGNQAVKFNSDYFNAVKKKGYDALIDDNDAGIWSREPTILLNPKQTVKVTKVRQLTAKEINDAQRDVLKYRDYKNKNSG